MLEGWRSLCTQDSSSVCGKTPWYQFTVGRRSRFSWLTEGLVIWFQSYGRFERVYFILNCGVLLSLKRDHSVCCCDFQWWHTASQWHRNKLFLFFFLFRLWQMLLLRYLKLVMLLLLPQRWWKLTHRPSTNSLQPSMNALSEFPFYKPFFNACTVYCSRLKQNLISGQNNGSYTVHSSFVCFVLSDL